MAAVGDNSGGDGGRRSKRGRDRIVQFHSWEVISKRLDSVPDRPESIELEVLESFDGASRFDTLLLRIATRHCISFKF